MVLKFEQVRHLLRTRWGPACTGVVDTLRCTSPLTPPAHSRCGKFHTFSFFFNPPLPTSCRYWHRRRRPTWGTTRWRTAWRGWRSPWTRCPPSPCWSRRGQEHWSRCTWSVRNVGEWMFTVIQDSRAIQYSSLMRKCTYNESIVSTPQSGGEGNVSPEIYSDQKLPEESSN